MKENKHSPYRCVIVDDDPTFLLFLSRYIHEIPKLELYGKYLDSHRAINGITEDDNIDFLFLDISMGNISGLDIARILRDKVKYIVFISVSGEYALEALQLGGDHYLVKPVTFQKFLETVNTVLKRDRRSKTIVG